MCFFFVFFIPFIHFTIKTILKGKKLIHFLSLTLSDDPFTPFYTCSVPHIDPNKVLKVFGRSWPITIEPVWSRDNRPLETPYKQPARNQKGPLLTVILWPNKPSYYVRYIKVATWARIWGVIYFPQLRGALISRDVFLTEREGHRNFSWSFLVD